MAKHTSLNHSVASSYCFHLSVSFSSLCWPPSSASLSLSYIHVYCTAPVRRMKWLFRVSLLYPAVNPLPSETLPFPFPDIPTDMHTQANANAQSIHNNPGTHTYTHSADLQTFSGLLHIQAWTCVCVGIWVGFMLLHVRFVMFSHSPPSCTPTFSSSLGKYCMTNNFTCILSISVKFAVPVVSVHVALMLLLHTPDVYKVKTLQYFSVRKHPCLLVLSNFGDSHAHLCLYVEQVGHIRSLCRL